MKIAISGVHGQGKTTILNYLKNLEEFKNYKFVDSPTRALQTTVSINENGTQDTQVSIMYNHYSNVANNGNNAVFDRCALDGMAYTKYFTSKINISVLDSLFSMYYYLMQQYDLVFYIAPELVPTSDGTRSVDMPFFEAIKSNFEYLIKTDMHNVITLSGSVEQRVNTILSKIK